MELQQIKGNDDKEFLKLLFGKFPQIKQLEQQVKGFKRLFQSKQDGLLKNWIDEVIKSEYGLKNFFKNLIKDYRAVYNAVITSRSNGQGEGLVNRIKSIKRKMYGRAGFEFLRKMVLAKSA